ncbi:TIGR00730 family Rossman fold protein [Actimicrobium sp. CCC2.4]|nr:TIGR00730 family Rossman fold protein [Actimicrobium sp. CCC2.4]MEB0135660.1 TIGR00730 family Rossman fold protein [Actimicrobium sp. CCC2.4]WPX33778.1 TIGR00730 family Rossman fold protein [Actimicrobium sp. CCC2.4]
MTSAIHSLCVYCGASSGNSAPYVDAARLMGKALVEHDIALVYGGGQIGLMGAIADEVLRLGGSATGVIPHALLGKEVGHPGLTKLHVVKDMHERKAMMAELSDGFIAMPGGMGTMEELFEMLTWSQLGFHDKPIGLLNVMGFYDGLIGFVDHMVTEGFLRAHHRQLLMQDTVAASLVGKLRSYRPGQIAKLLNDNAARTLVS